MRIYQQILRIDLLIKAEKLCIKMKIVILITYTSVRPLNIPCQSNFDRRNPITAEVKF